MSPTREEYVGMFNRAAGALTHEEGGEINSIATCFSEELAEFSTAVSEYLDGPTEDNRKELAKEWADVQVTLSNFAWFFSLDGEEAFTRVAENNLTKIVDGVVIHREDGKVLKPEGYVKPDMSGL